MTKSKPPRGVDICKALHDPMLLGSALAIHHRGRGGCQF